MADYNYQQLKKYNKFRYIQPEYHNQIKRALFGLGLTLPIIRDKETPFYKMLVVPGIRIAIWDFINIDLEVKLNPVCGVATSEVYCLDKTFSNMLMGIKEWSTYHIDMNKEEYCVVGVPANNRVTSFYIATPLHLQPSAYQVLISELATGVVLVGWTSCANPRIFNVTTKQTLFKVCVRQTIGVGYRAGLISFKIYGIK